jgi:hypothetical protein
MHITTIAAFVQSYETSSLFTIVKINDKNKCMYVSTDFIDFLWKQSLETIFSAKKTIFNTLKHSKLTQIIEISYLTPPKNFLNGFTPISKMTKTTAIKVEMCGKFSSLLYTISKYELYPG